MDFDLIESKDLKFEKHKFLRLMNWIRQKNLGGEFIEVRVWAEGSAIMSGIEIDLSKTVDLDLDDINGLVFEISDLLDVEREKLHTHFKQEKGKTLLHIQYDLIKGQSEGVVI